MADATVLGVEGEPVLLRSLWATDRCCLVFFRHLGCRFCWQLASALTTMLPALTRSGVRLIGISSGTAAQAKLFRSEANWAGELYVEPEDDPSALYRSYRSFSLLRVGTAEAWEKNGLQAEAWQSQEANGALQDRPLIGTQAGKAATEAVAAGFDDHRRSTHAICRCL